jgi:hypothetical protein
VVPRGVGRKGGRVEGGLDLKRATSDGLTLGAKEIAVQLGATACRLPVSMALIHGQTHCPPNQAILSRSDL